MTKMLFSRVSLCQVERLGAELDATTRSNIDSESHRRSALADERHKNLELRSQVDALLSALELARDEARHAEHLSSELADERRRSAELHAQVHARSGGGGGGECSQW